MKAYEVTYHVHDGWQYNEPKSTSEKTEIIVAEDKDAAYEIAAERASTPSLIAHDPVSVNEKDVKLIKGCNGKIIALMHGRFNRIDIGVSALGESTLIALKNGHDFSVETVRLNDYGYVIMEGYEDGKNKSSAISALDVSDDELKEVLHSVECQIGEYTRKYNRQYIMLFELVNRTSPFGQEIPAEELGLDGVCENVRATRLSAKEGDAVLLHWPLEGDYTRAMVIPATEFTDKDRVIEAIEAFCEA